MTRLLSYILGVSVILILSFSCLILSFLSGEFTYALFDLLEDPYETNNLYYSIDDDSDLGRRKALLYQKITEFHRVSRVNLASAEPTSKIAPKIWKEIGGDYIVPYVAVEEEAVKSSSVFYHKYPSLCMPEFEGHGFGLSSR